jgi:hypothetical protein
VFDVSFCPRNEHLAVRNPDGGFYVCQALQNIYKQSRKVRIRWLSLDTKDNPGQDIYSPDFTDVTGE